MYLVHVFAYALIPAAATTIGGAAATVRAPGPKTGSVIAHFGEVNVLWCCSIHAASRR